VQRAQATGDFLNYPNAGHHVPKLYIIITNETIIDVVTKFYLKDMLCCIEEISRDDK